MTVAGSLVKPIRPNSVDIYKRKQQKRNSVISEINQTQILRSIRFLHSSVLEITDVNAIDKYICIILNCATFDCNYNVFLRASGLCRVLINLINHNKIFSNKNILLNILLTLYVLLGYQNDSTEHVVNLLCLKECISAKLLTIIPKIIETYQYRINILEIISKLICLICKSNNWICLSLYQNGTFDQLQNIFQSSVTDISSDMFLITLRAIFAILSQDITLPTDALYSLNRYSDDYYLENHDEIQRRFLEIFRMCYQLLFTKLLTIPLLKTLLIAIFRSRHKKTYIQVLHAQGLFHTQNNSCEEFQRLPMSQSVMRCLCVRVTYFLRTFPDHEFILRLCFKLIRLLHRQCQSKSVASSSASSYPSIHNIYQIDDDIDSAFNVRDVIIQSGFCDEVLRIARWHKYKYDRHMIPRILKLFLAIVPILTVDLMEIYALGVGPHPPHTELDNYYDDDANGYYEGYGDQYDDCRGYQEIHFRYKKRTNGSFRSIPHYYLGSHSNSSIEIIWRPFLYKLEQTLKWERRKHFCLFLVGSNLLFSSRWLPTLSLMFADDLHVYESSNSSALRIVFFSIHFCKRIVSFL